MATVPPVTARCPLADAVEPSGFRQVPPYWLTGARGYEDARRRQESQGAPIVLYFFTEWCPHCRRVDRDLFASSEAERYFSRAVLRVRVNPETDEGGRRLADEFGVSGYPSFFVVLPGDEPRRTSLFEEGGGLEPASPEELQARIEAQAQLYARRLIREGYELRAAGDLAGALPLLDRALQAAPREAEGFLQRAIVREGQGALDEALADYALVALLRPGGRAHERAVHALQQARRFDEAVACATDWMGREPNAIEPLRQRARSHFRRGDLSRAREDAEHGCALGDEEACRAAGRG
jgi:thioredoxin-like negative regulator of GroEL